MVEKGLEGGHIRPFPRSEWSRCGQTPGRRLIPPQCSGCLLGLSLLSQRMPVTRPGGSVPGTYTHLPNRDSHKCCLITTSRNIKLCRSRRRICHPVEPDRVGTELYLRQEARACQSDTQARVVDLGSSPQQVRAQLHTQKRRTSNRSANVRALQRAARCGGRSSTERPAQIGPRHDPTVVMVRRLEIQWREASQYLVRISAPQWAVQQFRQYKDRRFEFRDGVNSSPGILRNGTPFALTSPPPYICEAATHLSSNNCY